MLPGRWILLALAVIAACPATGTAAQKAISGKLSKPGYDVIAIASSGRVSVARARPAFKLVPPAGTVTLHLRNASGRYAGPVVVGKAGKRLVVGVRAGARLGRVVVARGFGRARPAARFRDSRRWARARNGDPLGARNLGRVRSASGGRAGVGVDPDRDGVPGAFDVDDDGDLRLDSVDRRAAGRAVRQVSLRALTETGDVAWVVNSGLQMSCLADQAGYTKGACGYAVNRNAAGPFAESAEFDKLVDILMVQRGALLFGLPAGGGELDCGGLSYCSPGGSGFEHAGNRPFPSAFDEDGDGHGTMVPVAGFSEGQDGLAAVTGIDPAGVFGLLPRAGAQLVRAGDTFVEETANGSRGATLNTVFGTLPALAAWSDGSRTVKIAYPTPTGAEGAENNAFTVAPANGRYKVSLTVWRPQRRAIANSGEGTDWIDMGGLTYTVVGKTAEQSRTVWTCPDSAYTTTDPHLTPGAGGLRDSAADAPVDVANTLTFTVDLTACLQSAGLPNLDRTTTLFVSARSAAGDAAEGVGFSFKNAAGGFSSADFGGTWRWSGGSPGTGIEFTASALRDASTQHFFVRVYGGLHATGGTAPAGWTCAAAGQDYDCRDGTLAPGQTINGAVTLDAPGRAGMGVDLVVCQTNGVCQGFGLTYAP